MRSIKNGFIAFALPYIDKPGLLRTSEELPVFISQTEFRYIAIHGLRPKPKENKKVVRMAPALCRVESVCFDKYYYKVSEFLYENEEVAMSAKGFFKWPANDAMWVDVEVED